MGVQAVWTTPKTSEVLKTSEVCPPDLNATELDQEVRPMEHNTKSWTGMADQMVNTWSEVGTQMWKNWFDLLGNATPKNGTDARFGLDAITQQFIDNQQLSLRLLKLSFNAWQELFPKIEAGENWQDFFPRYTQQMREQLDTFSSSFTGVSQDTTELWKLYLTQMQEWSKLWVSSLGTAIAPFSRATLSGSSEPWIELNNLYWNLLYEESFGSLMQSPLLGPTREFNGKLLRTFDAWTHLYRASMDYQMLLASIQVQSFEALMQDLVSRAEKGDKIKDWKQFQQVWGQVADTVFEQAFCDEANLKIRGRLLNSMNTYRIHQHALMEVWMQAMNMPLRSEIDEVHKTLYELRREVKSLKKALAKYESQVSVATTAASEPAPSLAVEPAVEPPMATTTGSSTESSTEATVTEEIPASPASATKESKRIRRSSSGTA